MEIEMSDSSDQRTIAILRSQADAWVSAMELCRTLRASDQPTGALTVTRFIRDLYDDRVRYERLMLLIKTISQGDLDKLVILADDAEEGGS